MCYRKHFKKPLDVPDDIDPEVSRQLIGKTRRDIFIQAKQNLEKVKKVCPAPQYRYLHSVKEFTIPGTNIVKKVFDPAPANDELNSQAKDKINNDTRAGPIFTRTKEQAARAPKDKKKKDSKHSKDGSKDIHVLSPTTSTHGLPSISPSSPDTPQDVSRAPSINGAGNVSNVSNSGNGGDAPSSPRKSKTRNVRTPSFAQADNSIYLFNSYPNADIGGIGGISNGIGTVNGINGFGDEIKKEEVVKKKPGKVKQKCRRIVFVEFKVKRISDIDNTKESFRCKFHYYLTWLATEAEAKRFYELKKKKEHDQYEPLWMPKLEFDNALREQKNARFGVPSVRGSDSRGFAEGDWFKEWGTDDDPDRTVEEAFGFKPWEGLYNRVRFDADMTFAEELELEAFPFDCQNFSILMKSERDQIKDVDLVPMPRASNWLSLDPEFSVLQEWTLTGVIAEFGLTHPQTSKSKAIYPQVSIQLKARRNWRSYQGIITLTFCMYVLGLCAFGMRLDDIESFGNRLSFCVTFMLADVASIQFVFGTTPAIPYNTTLDSYVYGCFYYLMGITVWTAIAARWDLSYVEPKLSNSYVITFERYDEDEVDPPDWNLDLYAFIFFGLVFSCIQTGYILFAAFVRKVEKSKLKMSELETHEFFTRVTRRSMSHETVQLGMKSVMRMGPKYNNFDVEFIGDRLITTPSFIFYHESDYNSAMLYDESMLRNFKICCINFRTIRHELSKPFDNYCCYLIRWAFSPSKLCSCLGDYFCFCCYCNLYLIFVYLSYIFCCGCYDWCLLENSFCLKFCCGGCKDYYQAEYTGINLTKINKAINNLQRDDSWIHEQSVSSAANASNRLLLDEKRSSLIGNINGNNSNNTRELELQISQHGRIPSATNDDITTPRLVTTGSLQGHVITE